MYIDLLYLLFVKRILDILLYIDILDILSFCADTAPPTLQLCGGEVPPV